MTEPTDRALTEPTDRAYAEQLDADDPLAPLRARFEIPDDSVVYLDGNSLGRLPAATPGRVAEVLHGQWGDRLIRSWDEGWMDLPVQIGDRPGLLEGEAVPQQLSEQRVVAEPLVGLAQRDDERIGAGELLQHPLAVRPPGQGVGQVTAEPVRNAGVEQERPVLRWQPLDHLPHQVVGDGPVVPGESGDPPVDVPGIQRHGRQPQPGRPALSSGSEDPDLFGLQMNALQVEEFGRLVLGEGQVTGPHLAQVTVHPQSVQPEYRVRPGEHDQTQLRRQVVDQLAEALVHSGTGDLVEVVQHQDDRAG